jgi:hypothetical protein
VRFDLSVILMLNSSAPQQEDCKEYRSSCVLILISKDEYTNINTTKEFGAAFICKKNSMDSGFVACKFCEMLLKNYK